MELELTKPIVAFGETRTKLVFREPTGADVRKCGVPFRLESGAAGEIATQDAEAAARLISVLANIPLSSVDQLNAFDFNQAMNVVSRFFILPPPKPSSTDTGNSQESSAAVGSST